MSNFGLIGKSLTYSFSPSYFKHKFSLENITGKSYKTFELEQLNLDSLNQIILTHKLKGFNVTIPYKESILPLLQEVSAEAKLIGAVNTVCVDWESENKYRLKGFNTDWIGFSKAVRPFLTQHHQKALILGTGGGAKAIAYALKALGVEFFWVGRHNKFEYENYLNFNEINENVIHFFKLIINTTPLGTFPQTDTFPVIPYHFLSTEHLLFDLVYNPDETSFMKKGRSFGATAINGSSMLRFQADEAWEIWNSTG